MIGLIKSIYWRLMMAVRMPPRRNVQHDIDMLMVQRGLVRSPYTGSWVTPAHIKRQREQYNPLEGIE